MRVPQLERILFVAWAGMAAGGYLGGALFDATGSFASAFEIAAASGLTAFLLLSPSWTWRRPLPRAPPLVITHCFLTTN